MSTNRARSFGVAIIVAIGVIAAMAAMGLFSTGPAHAQTGPPVTNVEFTPSTDDVNAAASWTVKFVRPASGDPLEWGTGTITVTFPEGVVLPATIDKSRITVGATTQYPPNTDPTVTGNTVEVTLPFVNPAGDPIFGTDQRETTQILISTPVTVKFSQRAGILNPSARGAAGTDGDASAGSVKTSEDTSASNAATALDFIATISLDKSSSPQGGTVMVTLGGFTPNLQVTLSGAVTGSGAVKSDGTAVIAGTMGGATGQVTATDGAGLDAKTTDMIMVTATLTATATGKAQDTITLEGRNYTPGSNVLVGEIKFGGKPIGPANVTATDAEKTSAGIALTDKDQDGDDDDFTIKVQIPSNAPSGVNQIKVTDAGTAMATATATVDVAGRTVTLSPSSGAPGTAVTVSVTGFPGGNGPEKANTITIDPGDADDTVDDLLTTSSGGLSGTNIVTIPSGATEGTIEVTVSIQGVDGEATKGSATFTVVSRGLTVTPASGPKGTSILLSGGNYLARGSIDADSILVGGKDTLHADIDLDSSGSIPATSITVPDDASYGDVDVTLVVNHANTNNDSTVSGAGTFTVTQPSISLAPATVAMGNDVSVTGEGWVPNSIVTIEMKRTGGRALTTAVVTSDGTGGFTSVMTVPNNVGVGPDMVSLDAHDGALGNETLAVNLTIPAATIALSPAGTATVGDRVTVMAAGFTPSTGLSELTIGGANVREGVDVTDEQGNLTTSFTVPGLTGSQLVRVTIGNDDVSTSLIVQKGTTSTVTDPRAIFASEIASGNLVRIFSFDNVTKQFSFFDPAFDDAANTLNSVAKGQVLQIAVNEATTFRGLSLTPVWNVHPLP